MALFFALGLGCSISPSDGGSGGSSGSGGTSNTGGTKASGGTRSGGAIGSGGSVASGGTTASGGKTGSGGTGAGGKDRSGGTTAAGGKQVTGGTSGDGGTLATGGTGEAGGATGEGGSTGAGGFTRRDGGPGRGGSTAGSTGTGGGPGGSTGTSANGGASGKSAGCGKTPTIASNQYNNGNPISISVGGKQRRYVLNVPKNYDNTKPYRLIVTIHQLDGNDKQMFNWQYYGLLPLSNDTAIFAAPNGQKNGSPCTGTGDGDGGCGWPNPSGQDMALVDAVVAQVEENFCVDTDRIFATGWSYGASMSYEVGCERPLGKAGADWGVRAIAIYSGRQMSGSCKPSTAIGFYGIHGTNDNVLGYDSGVSMAQNFAKANGCTWATPARASGAHVCTNIAGCKADYPVEFCSFVGGHTPFPDNGQSQGSWGPPEAWKFLSQF